MLAILYFSIQLASGNGKTGVVVNQSDAGHMPDILCLSSFTPWRDRQGQFHVAMLW